MPTSKKDLLTPGGERGELASHPEEPRPRKKEIFLVGDTIGEPKRRRRDNGEDDQA